MSRTGMNKRSKKSRLWGKKRHSLLNIGHPNVSQRKVSSEVSQLELFYISSLPAAWAFYEDHKSELSWDLVTLCPPYVRV